MTTTYEGRIRAGHYRLPAVDGYQLTAHALGRMIERHIHVRTIHSALTHPVLTRATTRGGKHYIGEKAAVIVDEHTKTILTVCQPRAAGGIR